MYYYIIIININMLSSYCYYYSYYKYVIKYITNRYDLNKGGSQ